MGLATAGCNSYSAGLVQLAVAEAWPAKYVSISEPSSKAVHLRLQCFLGGAAHQPPPQPLRQREGEELMKCRTEHGKEARTA